MIYTDQPEISLGNEIPAIENLGSLSSEFVVEIIAERNSEEIKKILEKFIRHLAEAGNTQLNEVLLKIFLNEFQFFFQAKEYLNFAEEVKSEKMSPLEQLKFALTVEGQRKSRAINVMDHSNDGSIDPTKPLMIVPFIFISEKYFHVLKKRDQLEIAKTLIHEIWHSAEIFFKVQELKPSTDFKPENAKSFFLRAAFPISAGSVMAVQVTKQFIDLANNIPIDSRTIVVPMGLLVVGLIDVFSIIKNQSNYVNQPTEQRANQAMNLLHNKDK